MNISPPIFFPTFGSASIICSIRSHHCLSFAVRDVTFMAPGQLYNYMIVDVLVLLFFLVVPYNFITNFAFMILSTDPLNFLIKERMCLEYRCCEVEYSKGSRSPHFAPAQTSQTEDYDF